MKPNSTTLQPKVSYPRGWPYIMLASTPLMDMAIKPVLQARGISMFALPWVFLLVWSPFLLMDWRRRQKASQQETAAMEARFEAQDIALFGRKLDEVDSGF